MFTEDHTLGTCPQTTITAQQQPPPLQSTESKEMNTITDLATALMKTNLALCIKCPYSLT